MDIDIIVEMLGDEVEDVIYSYKALRDVKQGQPSKGLKYKVLRPKVVFLSAAFGEVWHVNDISDISIV